MNQFDFLTVDTDEAAIINAVETHKKKKTRKDDVRFWKPTINNPQKEYQAKVRMLPRGMDGLINKIPVSVAQHVHFIKEPESGLYLTVKCRKTLGDHEKCPICEYNWNMWHTGVEHLKEIALKRKANVSYISNFYIRQDLTTPTFDGSVRLWEHTAKTNEMLMAPTKVTAGATPGFKKKSDKFTPYSPKNGRDLIVLMQENPKNQFPTYEGSFWDEDGLTDLAGSNEEMMAILENCYDLSEFIEDVPTSEDLATRYSEFCQALEEKTNGKIRADIGTTKVHMPGETTTSVSAVKGDSSSYFNQSTRIEGFDKPAVGKPITHMAQKPVEMPLESLSDDDAIEFVSPSPKLPTVKTNKTTASMALEIDDEDNGEDEVLPF